MSKKLRIALLGTRGIPANYGGFETFVEEISKILSSRGHTVTVYGRNFRRVWPTTEMIGKVRSIRTWTFAQKYLETPLHAISTNIDLLFRRSEFDCALLCNAANSPFSWMLRAIALPFAINVDGIERKRSKWNALGRFWYRLGEYCSTLFANRVVGDAAVICEYYKEAFDCNAVMIPYGAFAVRLPAGKTLEKFKLSSDNFILYVSRLEPENNALGVIDAYRLSGITDIPLVIVGDAPYAAEYKQSLYDAALGLPVIFTGFQFGDSYKELRTHCRFYIQATEVGGTHPALIEGLCYGNPTIINGTEENIEVAGNCSLTYEKNNFSDLSECMKKLHADKNLREDLSRQGQEQVANKYSWNAVADQYEKLFLELL